MIVRVTLLFLLAAAWWSLRVPDRAVPEEDLDPEAYADVMGLPDVFERTEAEDGSHGIDPVPHRSAIDQLETVLYRRGPTDFGDAETVESVATRLALEIMGDGLRGRRAGAELLSFAGRVGMRTDVGTSLPSIVGIREEWESVRARVFRPAPWMRTAHADLDAIQEPPPPAMDPRTETVLRDAEGELHRLLRRGQRDVERLGEPVYDPEVPGRADRGQIRAWYDWGEQWRRRLAAAMQPVDALSPAPDPGREPLHDEAVRALREAHEGLRRVPDGAGMWPTPFRPTWESHFRQASSALARARETLARLEADEGPGRARSVEARSWPPAILGAP